jgi:hypothetical protein
MTIKTAEDKPIDKNKTLHQIKIDKIKKKIDAMFPDPCDENHERSELFSGVPLFNFYFHKTAEEYDESQGQFMDSYEESI